MVRVAALAMTLCAGLAGCAGRLERSHALSQETQVLRSVAREASPERTPPPRFATSQGSEFVRASAIRLSLPGAVLRPAPPLPQIVYVPVPVHEQPEPPSFPYDPEGPYGPVGDGGTAYVGTGCAPCYGGYGGYYAPGGAVPPGLRPPSDGHGHVAPSARPYVNAFPAGDVVGHRPGLSVGSGLFGRHR